MRGDIIKEENNTAITFYPQNNNSTTHTNNGWNLLEPSQIQAIESQHPVTKKRKRKVYINTHTRISTNLNIKCVILITLTKKPRLRPHGSTLPVSGVQDK